MAEENKPDQADAPEHRRAEEVAQILTKAQERIGELALYDLHESGSNRLRAVDEVVGVLVELLRFDEDDRLQEIRKAARAPTKRTQEVELYLGKLRTTMAELTKSLDGIETDFAPAARTLAGNVIDFFGFPDLYEHIRAELPSTDDMDKLRPELEREAERQLLQFDDRDAYVKSSFRALLRAAGADSKKVDGMTEFIRKRDEKAAK
jgi:hypothetical protein